MKLLLLIRSVSSQLLRFFSNSLEFRFLFPGLLLQSSESRNRTKPSFINATELPIYLLIPMFYQTQENILITHIFASRFQSPSFSVVRIILLEFLGLCVNRIQFCLLSHSYCATGVIAVDLTANTVLWSRVVVSVWLITQSKGISNLRSRNTPFMKSTPITVDLEGLGELTTLFGTPQGLLYEMIFLRM